MCSDLAAICATHDLIRRCPRCESAGRPTTSGAAKTNKCGRLDIELHWCAAKGLLIQSIHSDVEAATLTFTNVAKHARKLVHKVLS